MIASMRHGDEDAREIARGLALAVQGAVESRRDGNADARALSWAAAVDVAELLDLSGLSQLLAVCETHVEAPPLAVTHALDRLARLAQEALTRGDVTPFEQADRELGALAGTLTSQEWSPPGLADELPESLQALGELLSDFELDDTEAIARARVTLPVAAGLRAALDWIGADLGGRLRVTVQDAALTLAARATHEPGLGPAGAILALTGGALLPEPDGRWSMRVPLHADRPAFLLVRQGELSLALPWHAVAQLRIADESARSVMTEPSLRPWSPLTRAQGERPAALLALGLTRAWLHLDHVVWRVFAQPEPAKASDVVPGGRLVVRTDEGGEYWVVEVSEALEGAPQLHTPKPQPRPRPPSLAVTVPTETALDTTTPSTVEIPRVPRLSHAPAASVVAPVPVEAGAPAAPEQTSPEPSGSEDVEEPEEIVATADLLPTLGADDVRPLGRSMPESSTTQRELDARSETSAATVEPAASAAPTEPASASPEEAKPARTSSRFALVVDDSLVARLSLGRVLEREGWMVEWVEQAGDMWEALHGSTWGVVFVDVSLPDASGRAHLRALVANQLAATPRFEVVALTRDASEERLAHESGITRTLRKPFTHAALEQLTRELPAPSADA